MVLFADLIRDDGVLVPRRTSVTAIFNRNLQGVSTDLLLRVVRSLRCQAKIILTKVNPAALRVHRSASAPPWQ